MSGPSDRASVVVCEPDDPYFGAAEALAAATGRALLTPAELPGGDVDAAWVAAPSTRAPRTPDGRVRVGMVTGPTPEAALALGLRAAEPPSPGRGWLCCPPWLARALPPDVAQAVDLVDPADLAEWLPKPAPWAVLAGHGREDVLYFDAIAVCARSEGPDAPACAPDACPYPQAKVPARAIGARVVAMLGCSAARMGPGLFPPSSRLAFAVVERAAACLSATHLFDLDAVLVARVVAGLLAGLPLGEVRDILATAHGERRVGCPDPFVVLGDPCVRAVAPTADVRDALAPSPQPLRGRLPSLPALDHLDALGLLPASGEDLRSFLRDRQRPLRAALRAPGDNLGAGLERMMMSVEEDLVATLCERSLVSYLWLVNHYGDFDARWLRDGVCRACGERTFVVGAEDPVSKAQRTRETCVRCGIRADWARDEDRVSIVGHELGEGLVRLHLDLPPGRAVLGVTLNAARDRLVSAHDETTGASLPGAITATGRHTVLLRTRSLPRGVHYAKAIVVRDLWLSCASHPVPHLSADRALRS